MDSIDDVVEDDGWIPADAPASRQPRWTSFRSRSFEEIFNEWQAARSKLLNLELEYAIGRKINPDAAAGELADVLAMIEDQRLGSGRPWTPPWDPGPQFEPDETPWKREWWSVIDQRIEGISTHGWSFDLEKVRANRAGDEQRQAEWKAHEESEAIRYYAKLAAERAREDDGSVLAAGHDVHTPAADDSVDPNIRELLMLNSVGRDTVDAPPPLDLAEAARTGSSEGQAHRDAQDSEAEQPQHEGDN